MLPARMPICVDARLGQRAPRLLITFIHVTAVVIANSTYFLDSLELVIAVGCELGGSWRSTTRGRRRVLGLFIVDLPLVHYTATGLPLIAAT